MFAWMGGKRKLVKNQRAIRKLEGVFEKVATKKHATAQHTTSSTKTRLASLGDSVFRKFMSLATSTTVPTTLSSPPSRLVDEQENKGNSDPSAYDNHHNHHNNNHSSAPHSLDILTLTTAPCRPATVTFTTPYGNTMTNKPYCNNDNNNAVSAVKSECCTPHTEELCHPAVEKGNEVVCGDEDDVVSNNNTNNRNTCDHYFFKSKLSSQPPSQFEDAPMVTEE